jgi:hypothetical protein
MAGQRQDYILRHIELLRKAVARLINAGKDARREESDEALQLAMHLQEKLFTMPAAQFLQQPVDGQIASLLAGESKGSGQAKCLAYAELLRETARIYQHRDREDLTAGAHQLALHVALHVALNEPADPAAVRALVTDLLAAIDPLDLLPPVREQLDEYIKQAG